MNLIKKRKQIERGRLAQELLDNPLFVEGFESAEKYLTESWGITKASEVDRREDVWRSLQLLQNIRQHITSVASNGKAVNKELLELNNKVNL